MPLMEAMMIKYPQALIGHLLTKADLDSAAGLADTAHLSKKDNVDQVNQFEVLRQRCSTEFSALWLQLSHFSEVIRRYSEPGALEVVLNSLQSVCKCHMRVEVMDDHRIVVKDEREEVEKKKRLIDDIKSCLTVLDSSQTTESGLIDCLFDVHTRSSLDAVMWRSLRANMEDFLGVKEVGSGGSTFYQLLSQLHKWCRRLFVHLRDRGVSYDSCDGVDFFLESGVKASTASFPFYNYFNERESRGLYDINSCSIDLPGQYACGVPKMENLIKVVRLSKGEAGSRDLKVQNKDSIQLLGSDGVVYSFSRNNAAKHLESDIQNRLEHLTSTIDWSLQQHLPSRGRGLVIQAPKVVYLGGGMTLMDSSKVHRMKSIQDIYLDYCAEDNKNPDWLVVKAHEFLMGKEGGRCEHDENSFIDGEIKGTLSQRKRMVYDAGCSNIPSTVLREFFNSSSVSLSDAFIVRRQFASQLGIHAAAQFLLSASPLKPHQLLLCPHTGKMMTVGLTPTYHSDEEGEYMGGQIHSLNNDHTVPFRLTRNIVGAISGSMLLGCTAVSIGCSVDAYVANKDVIKASLSLLLCDDIRANQRPGNVLSLVNVKVASPIYVYI